MATQRIPLFLLEVVLLPDAVLPLHIFEPRYKEMIRRCIGESLDFGVVLQRDAGIASVGCTAELQQTLKEYPDGRLDILTLGRLPFRIHRVIEEQSYFEAEVDFLDDQPGGSLDFQKQLLLKFSKLHQILFQQDPPQWEHEEVFSVAYSVASELPLDLDFKQTLLETRAERDRQRLLLERIEEWIPTVAHQQHIKKIAGGNGHGLH